MWRRSREVEYLRAGTIAAIGCLVANVCLASTLLKGDLGRWLNDKAVPALVQSLAKHPRFRGETVRVVAMRDGAPVPTTERLTQELQRELTHQLSEQDAVRIALPDAPKPCDLPEDRPFLLGVEVVPVQGNQYRVNIAVVDRDEGVWVNGLNLRWEGTLTRTQRGALSQATSTGTPGSVGHPIPIADHRAVVDQLASQMECVLRSGVSGTLALKPTEHTALLPIVRELGARASALPGVVVTAPADDPDWLLTTDLGGTMDRGSAELVLSLRPRDGAVPPQRVASIWISQPVVPSRPAVASAPPQPPVTPAAAPRVAIVPPAPPRPSIVPPARPIASPPPPTMSRVAPVTHGDSLMTPLRALPSPATGICVRSNAEGRCVDIELGLASVAYLFVFHTDPSGVHVHACRDQPLTANAGNHRYRLTLERPSADTIDVYAVATREPDLARLLNDVLRAGPGACGARAASPEAWFGRFKMLVDRYGLRIDWRSVHMSPDFRVLAMHSGE